MYLILSCNQNLPACELVRLVFLSLAILTLFRCGGGGGRGGFVDRSQSFSYFVPHRQAGSALGRGSPISDFVLKTLFLLLPLIKANGNDDHNQYYLVIEILVTVALLTKNEIYHSLKKPMTSSLC